MTRHRRAWIAAWLLAWAAPVSASSIGVRSLEAGMMLAEEGQFGRCGQEWERVGGGLLREARSGAAVDASFAFVAATRCYELANDARAYRVWAESVMRFLEGGSSWGEVRDGLVSKIETTERQLAIQTADELGAEVSLDLETTFLYRLDAVLDLLDYAGPKSGLESRTQESDQAATGSGPRGVPAYIPSVFRDEEPSAPVDAQEPESFESPRSVSVYGGADPDAERMAPEAKAAQDASPVSFERDPNRAAP